MGPAESYLDALKLSADRSAVAENEFRSQIAGRIKELERQRALSRTNRPQRDTARAFGPKPVQPPPPGP